MGGVSDFDSLPSFAATKNELHEFSPSKEPLLSMLEGEIQAMYMCKPGTSM